MENKGLVNFLPIIIEILLISFCSYCLWLKVLLPGIYYATAVALALIISLQFVRKTNTSFLVLQIVLFGLFLRNIFNLSANYGIIPFDDPNWDLGVVKTFLNDGSFVRIVTQLSSIRLLEWYSSWPVLHSLASVLSMVSGIDAFNIFLFMPSLISVASFGFIYLLVERVRKSLSLDWRVTAIGVLIYVTAAESLFWPMQFVHQNLGLFFFVIVFYAFYMVVSERSRIFAAIGIFFALVLVPTHSFTPVVAISFFVLFSLILLIGNRLGGTKFGNRFLGFRLSFAGLFFSTGLVLLAFLSLWWDSYGQQAYSYLASGFSRFSQIILGIRQFEALPSSASYPSVLKPPFFVGLLNLRDILVYVLPIIIGLYLIFFKIRHSPTKFYILYSVLTFGGLLVLNFFAFRVEPFRIIMLALPVFVILGAISYSEIAKRWRRVKKFLVVFISVTLIVSSMIGLWGHSFAPVHLYTPSISFDEVGERNMDVMRVNDFFSELPIENYSIILADDVNPLLTLLDPGDYKLIRQLDGDGVTKLEGNSTILVCAFKNLLLYSYYARTFSLVDTLQKAKDLQTELFIQLDNYTRIYDDGKYFFWVVN